MQSKPSRSRGVRNPGRNAALFGLGTIASVALVFLGISDMRATGRSGSPFLALGLFPALLCPLFFIHYVTKISVFRDLRSGRNAIARWVVSADQFARFCEEERRVPAHSILTNFYKPAARTPSQGVEVIFSDRGVLIDRGYFPLSVTGGRRVRSVRYIAGEAQALEFAMTLTAMARTSSATNRTVRSSVILRVPVAAEAERQADEVVRRYEAMIAQT